MRLSEFKVLDELWDDDDYCDVHKTTHPKIIFDPLDETFTVDIGEDCCAVIYGKNRMERALEIANLIWENYLTE